MTAGDIREPHESGWRTFGSTVKRKKQPNPDKTIGASKAAPRPLDVESNDMHNVKPWFTGRLDFVPPISFVGDDEFRLRGGSLAVFQGHNAAQATIAAPAISG
jgi:hypothetical protein